MEEEARGRTEVDPPALALASPVAAAARKTVRMSAARDVIIPDYTTTAANDDQGSFAFIAEEEEEGSGSAAGSSVSAEAFAAAAAAVRGALYRHGSDAGSPPPLGVPCEGALQDTPDYIRRSAARHRGVAPLELFSAAASSPRPGGGSCAAAEAVVTVAAAGTEGQTTVGGVLVVRAILQPKEEEVESGSCSQLRQQYACCGHASIWLGSSVILFEHDFSCPVMLLGVYPFYVRFAWFILLI